MRVTQYLQELIGLLQYHSSSGIAYYPRDEGTHRFVRAVEARAGAWRPRAELTAEAERADSGQTGPERGAGNVVDVDAVLTALIEEVAVCRACSLNLQRLAVRVGEGGKSKVRLMVVGDWLRCGTESFPPDSVQFGIEEDQMLGRMLQAIHLPMKNVYISNVIKCVPPETKQPAADHIRTCLSYLHRQIALLEPECICAMGLVAARALVEGSLPLSQLRGRFHSFAIAAGKQIPVMVTYHPSFLLNNPEMKKAAWVDLQEIGKRLKLL